MRLEPWTSGFKIRASIRKLLGWKAGFPSLSPTSLFSRLPIRASSGYSIADTNDVDKSGVSLEDRMT